MNTFDGRQRIRFPWHDGIWLSVTDVRLYENDLRTPAAKKIASLQRALMDAGENFLCFGLGRAWLRPGDDVARHYLQLNNVHCPSWAEWQLCPPVQ